MAKPVEQVEELDEGLGELEEDESSTLDEPDPEGVFKRRKIFTDKSDTPVASLHSAEKDGDLVLTPIFQRRKVWDDNRSSRLVESAILDVPLPVFYLAESPDGTQEVIDGQQRLRALFRFLDNEYALSSLKALPELNGQYFRDLVMHNRERYRMPVDDFALARGATAPVTSKQEAEKVWEPKFIAEIVSGKDPRVPIERETEFERPPTVADLLKLYRTRYVEVEPLKSRAGMLSQPNVLSAQLGTLPATALERPDAIEDFKARYANRDRDHQSLPGSVVSRLQLGNWSGSSASRRADSPCRARR